MIIAGQNRVTGAMRVGDSRRERFQCRERNDLSRLLVKRVTQARAVCVECLIGKQRNQFSLRSPSRIPYRTELIPCAKMAAYPGPDPPPVILLPESIAAQVTPSPGRGLLANQDRDD